MGAEPGESYAEELKRQLETLQAELSTVRRERDEWKLAGRRAVAHLLAALPVPAGSVNDAPADAVLTLAELAAKALKHREIILDNAKLLLAQWDRE